ncbi:HI1506-related protein [Xenorhabdus miraniensis]|uniref:Mu-like prophage FluMu protein gp35 n=1 Tax=Xenorhabdus miraniensis TaxID=351674 RepID=A0A2D0JT19_9GAMM|nr:HI1506-related protein [Xenorhabdus miraniensis]PHM49352.1 Mu-like prophage FluMu protein gp35 [Xenorhabdus miraniensis]
MSDETNVAALVPSPLVERVAVSVVNTAHAGYRRAGFILQPGENTLPSVTQSELQALEADPRLSVTVITADPDDDQTGGLENQTNPDETINLPPPAPTKDKRGKK